MPIRTVLVQGLRPWDQTLDVQRTATRGVMMDLRQELNAAIASHGMWSKTLKIAIRTEQLDMPIEIVRSDKECEFGKWLHDSTIAEKYKNSPHYNKILKLHAAFHEKAAIVAQFALSGNEAEAEKMMGFNGAFMRASSDLTDAIMDWLRAAA